MAGVSFSNSIIYYRSELVTLAIALDFFIQTVLSTAAQISNVRVESEVFHRS